MNSADETHQEKLQHENILQLIFQVKSFLVQEGQTVKDSNGKNKISKYYQILEFCDGFELADLIE